MSIFSVECMMESVTILVVGFFFLIYITVVDVQSWLKLNAGFVCIFLQPYFKHNI